MENVTISDVRRKAGLFLETANLYEEQVFAYLNGSDRKKDEAAYREVIKANRAFNKAYAKYFDEPVQEPHLDYELAESVME